MASKKDIANGTHARCQRCWKIVTLIKGGKKIHAHKDTMGRRCMQGQFSTHEGMAIRS